MGTHRAYPAVFLLLAGMLPAASRAQEVHAVIAGQVVDESGGPVSGATVTAESDTAAIAPASGVTGADGRYRIALLPPRPDYRLTVMAEGYQPIHREPLALRPGATVRLDLTLLPARADAPRDEAPDRPAGVDLGHTATDTVFPAAFIDGLPLLGRHYQDVLTLAPGVSDVDSTGNPNINGARSGTSGVRLDGALNTDPGYGGFGQNLNLESIEDLQVLSTGAPAPFGGAQGGFVNAITRSGGNRVSGAVKLFYRSDALDGDGAGNVDGGEPLVSSGSFAALQPFFEISGPILADKLWYSLALEYLSADEKGVPTLGMDTIDRTDRGWTNFGRISWQVNRDHRLAFELSRDTLASDGLGVDPLTSAESAFTYDQSALQGTVRWDWRAGPDLLLETLISGYRSSLEESPSSDTSPCPVDMQGRCNPFAWDLYTLDAVDGAILGPYFATYDDDRDRLSLRSDVTFFFDHPGGRGEVIRAGIEYTRQNADLSFQQDPIRVDATGGGIGGPIGTITFYDALPPDGSANAVSQRFGLYVEDQFRPIPSLSIRLGLRYDVEHLDADGYTPFDPEAEAARFLELYRIGRGTPDVDLVDAWANATVLYDINGDGKDQLHCALYDLDGSAFGDGMPDGRIDDFWTYFDGDFDGVVDPDNPNDFIAMLPDGLPDGDAVNPSCDRLYDDTFYLISSFTRHQLDDSGEPFSGLAGLYAGRGLPGQAREAERYEIDNGNVAPRVSIAWDPWKDGRTQFFATWGRYYGTIPAGLLLLEAGPDLQSVTYDASNQTPSAIPLSTGQVSTYLIDRDLQTPFTDEWTVGFQRELAPDWLLSLVYVNREAEHQLQDYEVNHYAADRDGDGVLDDEIGTIISSPFGGMRDAPDGIPDLYIRDPFFADVFRIGSTDRSEYQSVQIGVERRLRGRWQMIASYVYSEAKGDAEGTFALTGDDPSILDGEYSFLRYDATHAVKFSAVATLPWKQTLGGVIQWHSGLPYDLVERPVSLDNFGNPLVRTVYDTGTRNSERSPGVWRLDLAYRKLFAAGKVNVGFGAEVQNVLNSDDLRVTTVSWQDGNDIRRDFGRRWQLSLQLTF